MSKCLVWSVSLALIVSVYSSQWSFAQTEEELMALHETERVLLSDHNFDEYFTHMSEDMVYDFVPQPPLMDKEGFRVDFFEPLLISFPDFSLTEGLILASGNIVIEEHVMVGTQNGVWEGIPPTGNIIQFPHIDIFEYEEGKVVRATTYMDMSLPLVQAGAMPAPELPELVPSFTLSDPEPSGLSYLETAIESDSRWNSGNLNSFIKLYPPGLSHFLSNS